MCVGPRDKGRDDHETDDDLNNNADDKNTTEKAKEDKLTGMVNFFIQKIEYCSFRDNSSKGAFRLIFTVDFLLFLATARGSNPAFQSPNLT